MKRVVLSPDSTEYKDVLNLFNKSRPNFSSVQKVNQEIFEGLAPVFILILTILKLEYYPLLIFLSNLKCMMDSCVYVEFDASVRWTSVALFCFYLLARSLKNVKIFVFC